MVARVSEPMLYEAFRCFTTPSGTGGTTGYNLRRT
jgi:hypothetical protein